MYYVVHDSGALSNCHVQAMASALALWDPAKAKEIMNEVKDFSTRLGTVRQLASRPLCQFSQRKQHANMDRAGTPIRVNADDLWCTDGD